MSPKYHRFPPGERCEECGSRQWYAEDALRYCRKGHLLEGFADHSGGEDDFGTQGRTTRRKKEKRAKVAVKLTGDLGRELYLEVLQLVLRKQLWWLVKSRGFPEELEAIVQSLWALRVRQLPLKKLAVSASSDAQGSQRDDDLYAMSVASSLGGDGGFSSQSEGGGGGVSSSEWELSDTTTKTWEPDGGRRWKLPKLIDTLALCYLGCLTRRLPVATSDLHHWAQEGRLEYLTAFTNLPKSVRDRLPAGFHSALQTGDHIKPGHLHSAVEELILAFKFNFDVIFPPVNHVFTIVRYIRDLVLPFELYHLCTAIPKILDVGFSHPVDGQRRRSMRDPEVLMIALVVVSAKLRFPFATSHAEDNGSNIIDWSRWQTTRRAKSDEIQKHMAPGVEYKVTANDILTMDSVRLDDYMDWFEGMWLGEENSGSTYNCFRLNHLCQRPDLESA
ncbi:RNA polymerase I-specific transcription initiation factor RRN7 [Microdochium nivale]|nr:RNA polymerase I-specific transcription initiation factor RRN7 [Microdochium nivale]